MSKALRCSVLPLRELVLFPSETVSIRVGRLASINALEAAIRSKHRTIVLVSQIDRRTEDPTAADVFTTGVLARLAEFEPSHQEPSHVRIVEVTVLQRVRLLDLGCDEQGYFGHYELIDQRDLSLAAGRELSQLILSKLNEINRLVRGRYSTVELLSEPSLSRLLDRVSSILHLDVLTRQELLEELDLNARAQAILLALEVELATHRQDARREESDRRKARRDGGASGGRLADHDLDELRAWVAETELPDAARDRVERELGRLERMHVMSAEANILRTWVQNVLQVPWSTMTTDRLGLREAADILDRAHHGLRDPKDRILEYLAVRSQSRRASGPVLCLAGPPGVGKTSLARSVAQAMGREFVRVALGGVADEAQIRGHRRTYVGAMPGRIIGALQRAKSLNPVLLLDELDKLDQSLRGDPAAALLEVLDPEQNHSFRDHYLELGVDLSQVLFLCTANREERLPAPLLDRLEVLRLSGYSEEEKVAIAERFLIPKCLEGAGFAPGQVRFTRTALVRVIRNYTREAGVRGLDRALAQCARRLTRTCLERHPNVLVGELGQLQIGIARIERFLGAALPQRTPLRGGPTIGVSLGLSWSSVGGDVLRIEAVRVPGEGRLHLTGRLGEVMKESAELALSFLKAHALSLGINFEELSRYDVHVHLPEGAQPKEGPSAGLALALAIWSCLVGKELPFDMAYTGELTLTGLILPVGGLRAKLLAAQRYGLKRVVYPVDNQPQVDALPRKLRRSMELIPLHSIFELREVLTVPTRSGRKRPPSHVDA